jgi:hypothetical protein
MVRHAPIKELPHGSRRLLFLDFCHASAASFKLKPR